jgi:hypothetical protein
MNNYRVMLLLVALTTFSGFAFVSPAQAGTITTAVSVDGTDMPWNWVNLGLNTTDQFGINDGPGPVVISATNGFAFNSGDVLTLTYLSGLVSVGSSFPNTDAKGDTADAVNNSNGSTGKPFPSLYMNPATYPINLGELVGTFANSTGVIVGTPFAIGDGPDPVTIPTGATQLELGINDDRFGDNTGSWSIQVSGPGPVVSGVPEPGTAGLCGFALVCLGFVAHRRRAANAWRGCSTML